MGILDTFKGNQYKAELDALRFEYEQLKQLMSPEVGQAFSIQQRIDELNKQFSNLNEAVSNKNIELNQLEQSISQKKQHVIWLDEEVQVQEFGLYTPAFSFANALGYKEALANVRNKQKNLIKSNSAVVGNSNWTVNGSTVKGRKMVSDTQKLLLRAFNSECDQVVSKVKYTNFDASLDKIKKLAEAISKLGTMLGISITRQYMDLKTQELRLAFEYQLKKQKENEELKAARAEQREQARIQRELEEQRRKLEKEQCHYQSAQARLHAQLALDPNNPDLLQRSQELNTQLANIERAIDDVDYRQANMRAGYVYIISNIGSFGKDVYKIGMTRRLEPQERIDELGDASVPFNFDVHAMIFSDDAPALEAALHRAFDNRKLNMVNHRREFFHVTLDEIKTVIKQNFDKTVEFTDVADAEQYRVSIRMRNGERFAVEKPQILSNTNEQANNTAQVQPIEPPAQSIEAKLNAIITHLKAELHKKENYSSLVRNGIEIAQLHNYKGFDQLFIPTDGIYSRYYTQEDIDRVKELLK